MRVWFTSSLLCLTLLVRPSPASAQGEPAVSGIVIDARSQRPLAGVTVQISPVDDPGGRRTTTTGETGRFVVRVARRGNFAVVARSPGFSPFGTSVRVAGDSIELFISLSPLAQSLPEVSVVESEVDLFVHELRRTFKPVGRSRLFDASQMEKTGQLLAGPFLLGQAGIIAVNCQRSAAFLPEGKVRTEPVQKEPADIWWPCFLDRGKPRSIMIRIDGGPPEPFDAISNRVLSEFAAMSVVQGGMVFAYTKDYALRQRQRR